MDPSGGPLPGTHSFFRGGSSAYYDAEARAALAALHGHIDTHLAAEVWEAALAARWGDLACDTTIAWTFLSGEIQRVFKEQLPADKAT